MTLTTRWDINYIGGESIVGIGTSLIKSGISTTDGSLIDTYTSVLEDAISEYGEENIEINQYEIADNIG